LTFGRQVEMEGGKMKGQFFFLSLPKLELKNWKAKMKIGRRRLQNLSLDYQKSI
jgi:hypothetical protein